MSADSISGEAKLLAQTEQCAQYAADLACVTWGMDRQVAVGSLRWAYRWKELYSASKAKQLAGKATTIEAEITTIRRTQCEALDYTVGVELEGPECPPTSRARRVAEEVFCLLFDKDNADRLSKELGMEKWAA